MPRTHLVNVVSLISDRGNDLALTHAAPMRFHDRLARATYYIGRMDARCYLVVTLGEQAVRKDASIVDAVVALHNSLRATSVYDKLLKL